jgi:hypothetical protein
VHNEYNTSFLIKLLLLKDVLSTDKKFFWPPDESHICSLLQDGSKLKLEIFTFLLKNLRYLPVFGVHTSKFSEICRKFYI